MKSYLIAAITALMAVSPCLSRTPSEKKMDKFIDRLMAKMTVEEKIGQLNLSAGGVPTVVGAAVGQEDAVRRGLMGATGGGNPEQTYKVQKIASEESRLKIPLLVGLDVIHGYRTVFPIPLASSCSWNIPLIEQSARVAALEASSVGVNWTFSPMVDICRDARWGRIAESAGEDAFLGSRIAEAMVRGYQGTNLSADTTILACVKHFALYGASESGRDYNTVDMSRVAMYNYYMPPYRAAVDAGAGSVMTSFNVVDGIPSTGNRWLLTDLLRHKWGFKGFVVSDAIAVNEMQNHGMGTAEDVAGLALHAGTDMELGADLYPRFLKKLLNEGRLTMAEIDTACRRILEAKYKLGLFDDPYRYFDKKRQSQMESAEHLAVARQLADESVVLLKNDSSLLPLKPGGRIAIIGPLGDDKNRILGTWRVAHETKYLKSILQAVKETVGNRGIVDYARGSNLTEDYMLFDGAYSTPTDSLIPAAVEAARAADVVIAAVGEPDTWSGEAHSCANIEISRCQKKLLAALKQTGKPVVLLVLSGRPMVLSEEDRQFATIVEAWHGGAMAADAIADVLFGKVNPSAKLTTSFPRTVGQLPLYYNELNTGRPFRTGTPFATRYIDLPDISPLFPFGYGLSYTTYRYGELRLSKKQLKGEGDVLEARVTVTNAGNMDGKEIVQLYIGDPIARISRPKIELKGFEKVFIPKGESREVVFRITPELLKYSDFDGHSDWDGGDFRISVGPNSAKLSTVTVNWQK